MARSSRFKIQIYVTKSFIGGYCFICWRIFCHYILLRKTAKWNFAQQQPNTKCETIFVILINSFRRQSLLSILFHSFFTKHFYPAISFNFISICSHTIFIHQNIRCLHTKLNECCERFFLHQMKNDETIFIE